MTTSPCWRLLTRSCSAAAPSPDPARRERPFSCRCSSHSSIRDGPSGRLTLLDACRQTPTCHIGLGGDSPGSRGKRSPHEPHERPRRCRRADGSRSLAVRLRRWWRERRRCRRNEARWRPGERQRERQHGQPLCVRRAQGGLRQADPGVQRDRGRQGRRRSSSPTAPRATSRARSWPAQPADIVNFSVEPDVTRLVKAGQVDKNWNADATKGIPFGSVVTLVVRKGNPKNIKDWDDLLQPGIEVVTPSPLSSGSAKWNLLAPYAAKSNGGQDHAGRAGLRHQAGHRARQDPARVRPRGHRRVPAGHAVTCCSATRTRRSTSSGSGEPVEHVNPPQTFKIENPVAVRDQEHRTRTRPPRSTNFLFTPEAQKLWAEAGFRPVDPTVAAGVRRPTSRRRRSCGPSPTSVAGRHVDPRCSTRTSAPSPRSTSRPLDDGMTTETLTARGVQPRPHRRRRRWRQPPAAGACQRPARRHAPLGVGVASLWLSVIVLLPLAALTRRSRRRRPGRLLEGGHLPRGARVVPGHAVVSVGVTVVNAVFGTAGRLGAHPRRVPGQAARRRGHRPARSRCRRSSPAW